MSSDVSSEQWILAAAVDMEDDKEDSRMSVERIVVSMRDILVGEPSPRIIEQTLAKYCSKDIAWQIHDTTYRFHELIPYVLHSRNRMVDAEIEVTHFLANGNMSSNRHIVHFFRHDGTTCDLECFQIITLGKDGRFLDIAESTRVTNDTQMKSLSSEQAMKMYSDLPTTVAQCGNHPESRN
ncbi:hypothetical protein HII31_03890 [Pseudocercospora fuligena]|uniref:SnoaL-like domain-containing protein n=1 Tax=Pseudocercospora fuligena TaxID=685502 RepID=A0A8H6RQ48_9PEZI|nr:hypothetical protein HII31_03890 [Pseudocercospora fuligena]